jgi:hypothetical protein
MTDVLDDNEIDASKIFRSEATGLISVRNLDDALEKFGYAKDDRIARADLVKIFSTTRKIMEKEVHRLSHSQGYNEAEELRGRLGSLRNEFENLQTDGVKVTHNDQLKEFHKSQKLLLEKIKTGNDMQEHEVKSLCQQLTKNQKRYHEIEWENLDLAISRIPIPRMKYRKRTQELIRAEHELIKLDQYEDAKKVRYMLDRILPKEEKEFYDTFNTSIEDKRKKLRAKQDEENTRLDEKLKGILWDDLRKREKNLNVTEQRIKNHLKDMSHFHLLESKLKPELSAKPSALWQKRKGYDATSASLRGQQLNNIINNKAACEKVFCDTLVDKHFFDGQHYLDTVTINSY